MRSVSPSQGNLDPDSRFDLLRAIQSEHPLKAGLIFTYSANVAPLYAVLLTLAGSSSSLENAEAAAQSDPAAILRSIQSLESKLRIFVHAGGFRPAGAGGEQMMGLLDTLIREFLPLRNDVPDQKASFHPKVYLLAFGDEARTIETRLIVTSRNLTTDQSLDVVAAFNLVQRPRGQKAAADETPLSLFMKETVKGSRESVPAAISHLVDTLQNLELQPFGGGGAPVIRKARFHGQSGIAEGTANLSELKKELTSVVPGRRIVVSPFLSAGAVSTFFADKAFKKKNTYLLSTSEALDRICAKQSGVDLLSTISCYTLTDLGEQGFSGLHAKIILDDHASHAHIALGSANCSSRAWNGSNWECMISGETDLGLFSSMVADFFEGSEQPKRAPLADPYLPELKKGADEDSLTEQWSDALRAALVRAKVTHSTNAKDSLTTELEIELAPPPGETKYAIFVRPIASDRKYTTDAAGSKFTTTWDADLRSFSCFIEIIVEKDDEPFVTLLRRFECEDGLLQLRDQRALAWVVANAGPLQYLEQILGGALAVTTKRSPGGGQGTGAAWIAGLAFANLERLYLACIQERHLLPEIDRVLSLKPSDFPDGDKGDHARKALALLSPIWTELKKEFYSS